MIITNRQYPILKAIENRSLDGMPTGFKINEFVGQEAKLQELWEIGCKKFEKNITILSENFASSLSNSATSLIKNMRPYLNEIEDCSGVMIYKEMAICYWFSNVKTEKGVITSIQVFAFQKGVLACMASLQGYDFLTKDETKGYIMKSLKNDPISALQKGIVLEMFKKYAKVETKYLPANKKVKDFSCKYVNHTNQNITILDSKWFTNLVKSDAFKVKGHFRLQPKKANGEWTKELIWINEFTKDGYTAPARKLKEFP